MIRTNDTDQSSLQIFLNLLLFFSALLALWGAIAPSANNWGYNSLGFFNSEFRFFVPVIMLLTLIPKVQIFVIRCIDAVSDILARNKCLNRVIIYSLSLLLFVFLFYYFRVQVFFLGDGQLCLRNLQGAEATNQIAIAFKREPLVGFFALNLYRLFQWLGDPVPAVDAYVLLSIFSGILFVIIVWKFVKSFTSHPAERLLLWTFFLLQGFSQLFFGYVENYSFGLPAILLFLFISSLYIKKHISIFWPIILFGVILTIHFGTLIFSPLLLFLLVLAITRRQYQALASAIVTSVLLTIALLWISGYSLDLITTVLGKSTGHVIPLTEPLTKLQSYTLFSWAHVVDLFNFFFLSYYASFLVLLLALVMFRTRVPSIPLETWFLILAAACGICFASIINCEIGMSRDWDLILPLCIGLPAAGAALWSALPENGRNGFQLLIPITMVSMIQLFSFVGVNSNEQLALTRFQTLKDSQRWNIHAKCNAEEELAVYYRSHHNYPKVVEHYERYISLDSSNDRVWANLAEAYLAEGNLKNAINCYLSMVRLNMGNQDILTNLGMLEARTLRYDDALSHMKQAEELAPRSALIKSNIGVILVENKKAYRDALPYFLSAIQLDSMFEGAYYNAAICFKAIGDTVKAQRCMIRLNQVLHPG